MSPMNTSTLLARLSVAFRKIGWLVRFDRRRLGCLRWLRLLALPGRPFSLDFSNLLLKPQIPNNGGNAASDNESREVP